MLNASPAYRLALPLTHRREHTFTAYTPDGQLLVRDVPIGGGSVSASLSSRVTRSASFTTSDEWFPVAPDDPLSPYHSIITISAGIGYPSGEKEVFPVFTGRVYSADRATDGQVSFRADDLAADVLAADFERPVNSQRGASCVAEIRRLVTDGYEWAVFGQDDVDDAPVPSLTWDDDRGKACDDLAAVVEGRWFTLGNGAFVVRRYAYTDPAPVIELIDGPNGTLTQARTTLTADGTYNSVVVTSERPDGGDPVTVIERNDNALSAARYGGLFGKRVMRIRAQSALATSEAQRIARSQLNGASALQRQWTVQCVPDMTLEPGDVIALHWRDVRDTQIIDSLTYPLSADTAMTISTRSSVSVGDTL